ncbi:efflux RND transporter periplasmic adaptor subunit [Rhodopirellula bahusiensis]|uniref:Multidrug resistance protein MdtA-like barrel-sandwich hybrid domain-containing protein n=1 Tax=Rhodopirellula bahusiensis TaxID=2014065 RepID=A0A2G1VZP0_9BACT|nr:HlyD family efflux transporter periplasmic adaptor subunit [Rhodopirellula bahusiensis]PHQ32237.1 hypothetical protein CEE69_26825 [Rhodopirellula bahusiensis]
MPKMQDPSLRTENPPALPASQDKPTAVQSDLGDQDVTNPTQTKSGGGIAGRIIPVVVNSFVSIAILGGSIALFVYMNATRAVPVPQVRKAVIPVVETAIVKPSDDGIDFAVDGVVIPFKRLEVPVEVSGRVESRSENCRIGRYVAKGEMLVQIDAKEYDLEVRRIREQLKQAEASLVELDLDIASRERQIEMAKQTLQIRRRETDRMRQLSERNAASTSEVDATRLLELQADNSLETETDNLKVARATRTRLQSARDLSQVQLERAIVDQERCTVRAPIAGIITQEPAEEGVYLQQGATVATVQDVSTMEIRCSLNMRQMNWLWGSNPNQTADSSTADPSEVKSQSDADIYRIPETPVTVKFDVDGSEYSWKGSLRYFDGAEVDRLTRMVACRVYVHDPEGQSQTITGARHDSRISLMTGMFVELEIHAKPQNKLLELPETALYPGSQVWKVAPAEVSSADTQVKPTSFSEQTTESTDDTEKQGIQQQGTLKRVNVRVAQSKDDQVIVYESESLRAGDRVVVSPLASPVEGIAVNHGGSR